MAYEWLKAELEANKKKKEAEAEEAAKAAAAEQYEEDTVVVDQKKKADERQQLEVKENKDQPLMNAGDGLQTQTQEQKDDWDNKSWLEKRVIETIDRANMPLRVAAMGVADTTIDTIDTLANNDTVRRAVSPWDFNIGTDKDQIGPAASALKKWWGDQNNLKPKTHGEKIVRDVSAILIPTVAGTGLLSGAARTLPIAGKLNATQNIIAHGALGMGVDAGITSVSKQSTSEHNAAKAVNDFLGTSIPWATKDTDSPDMLWKKHMMDSLMIGGAAEVFGAAAIFLSRGGKNAARYFPRGMDGVEALDETAAARGQLDQLDADMINNNQAYEYDVSRIGKTEAPSGGLIDRDARIKRVLAESEDINKPEFAQMRERLLAESGDYELQRVKRTEDYNTVNESLLSERAALEAQIADPVLSHQAAVKAAKTDEGVRRLQRDPTGIEGADPYINKLDPETAPVLNAQPNPAKAAISHYRIQNNVGTIGGQAQSVATEYWQKAFMEIEDGTERAAYLQRLFMDISPKIDTVIKKGEELIEIPAEEVQKSVDRLVDVVFQDDLSFEDFQIGLGSLLRASEEGEKFLDKESFAVVSMAVKDAMEQVFTPNGQRASAMITQQAADNVKALSEGVAVSGEAFDTTAHQQLIFEKLQAMSQEVRATQFIRGNLLQSLKIAESGNPVEVAKALAKSKQEFAKQLKLHRKNGAAFVDAMKAIVKNDPEWAKPMIAVYNATGGQVDTLHKMKIWTENSLGFFKKSIIDMGDPEIPSILVEQLWGVKYNSILSGLATVRAAGGNGLIMAAKPSSAFAGSLLRGDRADFTRSLYTYGGVAENFQRGLEEMGNKWRFANENPLRAADQGRSDLNWLKSKDKWAALQSTRDGLRAEFEAGNIWSGGQLAYLNITSLLRGLNTKPFVRYGINALTAVDGFSSAVIASGMKRAQAYDNLLKSTPGGVIDPKAFDDLQKKLYADAFHTEGPLKGLLKDSHAKWAGKEVALNLDNDTAKALEGFMRRVPAARALFMFPKTGLNGLNMAFTFTPGSSLIPGLTRAREVFTAVTDDEIISALAKHGYDEEFLKNSGEMHTIIDALKSEYTGRQMMGGTVMMATGLWALNGNLTGSGPKDHGQRKRLEAAGWKPHSINLGPLGWRSYKGFEPFEMIMGLTADIVNESQRVDIDVAEDWWRMAAWSIGANVSSKTFMSGLEPLVSMLSGDEGAAKRFIAMQIDGLSPYSGARSILNNAISPGLKDVENEIHGYVANRWKFLGPIGGELVDETDLYTGQPIGIIDNPINAAVNAMLPFFKQNGDGAEWRQWLIKTKWDGLSEHRRNRVTGDQLTPYAKQWIAKNIAKRGTLLSEIQKMSNKEYGPLWLKQLEDLKIRMDAAGADEATRQSALRQLPLYKRLDEIHDREFDIAYSEWHRAHLSSDGIKGLKRAAERAYSENEFGVAEEYNKLLKEQREKLEMEELLNYNSAR